MKAQQGIRFEIWVNQQQMKKFFNIEYYKIHFLIYQLDRFVMSDVFDLLSFWLSPDGNCCKGSKVEVTERKQQKTGRKKVFRTSRCVQAESHFYEENCCKKREEGKVFIFHLLLWGREFKLTCFPDGDTGIIHSIESFHGSISVGVCNAPVDIVWCKN